MIIRQGEPVTHLDGTEGVISGFDSLGNVWVDWDGRNESIEYSANSFVAQVTGRATYDAALDAIKNNPIEPNHYQRNGVNFIEFIEHMPGNRFNAMKYIYRAGEKNPETLLEDLKKGQWSLNREIERLERDAADSRD